MGKDKKRRIFPTEFFKLPVCITFALLVVYPFGISKFRSKWQSSDNFIDTFKLFAETIKNTKKLYCFLTKGFQKSNACHVYTLERASLATSLI